MAGETNLTLIGNLTGDPELRFTPSGAAVCSFTIAVQPRKFDKSSGGWVDGQASFYRCNAWRQMAENIAESFTKGNRVVVFGSIGQRSYETNDGEKRTVFEVLVEDIGASAKFAMVTIRRPERDGGQAQQRPQQQAQRPPEDPWGTPPAQQQRRQQPQQAAFDANDPWGTPPAQQASAANRGAYAPQDEPPF